MSLHPEPIGPVPAETARVARAAFPRGTTWLRLRDGLRRVGDIRVAQPEAQVPAHAEGDHLVRELVAAEG